MWKKGLKCIYTTYLIIVFQWFCDICFDEWNISSFLFQLIFGKDLNREAVGDTLKNQNFIKIHLLSSSFSGLDIIKVQKIAKFWILHFKIMCTIGTLLKNLQRKELFFYLFILIVGKEILQKNAKFWQKNCLD